MASTARDRSSARTGLTARLPQPQLAPGIVPAANRDCVGVLGEFGENGQCISRLCKDATADEVTGRAFAASLVAVESVAIRCDTVEITVAEDLPDAGARVSCALFAEPENRSEPVPGLPRWGLLRDSDPFVGSTTAEAQPSFALAFELDLP